MVLHRVKRISSFGIPRPMIQWTLPWVDVALWSKQPALCGFSWRKVSERFYSARYARVMSGYELGDWLLIVQENVRACELHNSCHKCAFCPVSLGYEVIKTRPKCRRSSRYIEASDGLPRRYVSRIKRLGVNWPRSLEGYSQKVDISLR